MKVVFSDVAYTALLAETYEMIRTETGGVFLGCCHDGIWYILETIDPGPRSVFRRDYFEYDQPYTRHLINKRARLYSHPLTLVGLWHRHPGSFDVFSSTDDGSNASYARLRPEGAISILVNIDPVFRLSVFHVRLDPSGRAAYTQIPYAVGDAHIPDAFRQLQRPEDMLLRIDSYSVRSMGMRRFVAEKSRLLEKTTPACASGTENAAIRLDPPASEGPAGEAPAMDGLDERRERLIDAVVDDISYLSDVIGFKLSAAWNGERLEIMDKKEEGARGPVFSFAWSEGRHCCLLLFDGTPYLFRKGVFSLLEDRLPPMASVRGGMVRTADVPQDGERTGTDAAQALVSIRDGVYRVLRTLLKSDEKG